MHARGLLDDRLKRDFASLAEVIKTSSRIQVSICIWTAAIVVLHVPVSALAQVTSGTISWGAVGR